MFLISGIVVKYDAILMNIPLYLTCLFPLKAFRVSSHPILNPQFQNCAEHSVNLFNIETLVLSSEIFLYYFFDFSLLFNSFFFFGTPKNTDVKLPLILLYFLIFVSSSNAIVLQPGLTL